jgi:hypothetical protein
VAAGGLALYAGGAGLVAVPLLRAGRSARGSTHAWMIQAACVWFVVAVAADAAVIATGRLRLLDGLGAVLIVGVLGQAILAALNHLAPMVWGEGAQGRAEVRGHAETWGRLRVMALNAGVGLVLAAAVMGRDAGTPGTVIARLGWTVIACVVLAQVVLVVRDARAVLPDALRGGSASRAGSSRPGS